MKTIILKVEIPNDAEIIGVNVQYSNGFTDDARYTELTISTEEEMILQANKYYMAIPKSHPKKDCDIAFLRGANWYKKQITG
jgi:hypothetical protein